MEKSEILIPWSDIKQQYKSTWGEEMSEDAYLNYTIGNNWYAHQPGESKAVKLDLPKLGDKHNGREIIGITIEIHTIVLLLK